LVISAFSCSSSVISHTGGASGGAFIELCSKLLT
jgi:hypothetical protein